MQLYFLLRFLIGRRGIYYRTYVTRNTMVSTIVPNRATAKLSLHYRVA